jgi:hypothetical protein
MGHAMFICHKRKKRDRTKDDECQQTEKKIRNYREFQSQMMNLPMDNTALLVKMSKGMS